MSEHNKSTGYMQKLDEWTESTIILPLYAAFSRDSQEVYVEAVHIAKKAIREKMLESYHNGQAVSPRRNGLRKKA